MQDGDWSRKMISVGKLAKSSQVYREVLGHLVLVTIVLREDVDVVAAGEGV